MKKYLKSFIPLTMIVILLMPLTVLADTGDWTPPNQYIAWEYPLQFGIGSDIGYSSLNITEGQCNAVLNYSNTEHPQYIGDTVCIIENGEDYTDVHVTQGNSFQENNNTSLINTWGSYKYRVYTDGRITFSGTTGNFIIGFNSVIAYDNNGNQVIPKSTLIGNYPIYTRLEEGTFFDYFTEESTPTPPATTWVFTHAKGGFESAYQDLNDLPDVDDKPPSDPTNNSAWYQKILNGMKQLGRNFLAGTLLITQTMHNDIEGLQNGTKDIGDILRERLAEILAEFGVLLGKTEAIRQLSQEQLDAIEDANAKSDPDTISSEWNAGYNASTIKGMVDTGQALKTSLGSIGTRSTGRVTFGAWRLEYNGNDLHLIGNYTLPNIFGGGTHQQDLSFAWYNNCREWVIWVVKAFFYVGFAWYLLHQVPNMIQGTGTTFRNISKGGKE